MLSGYWLDEGIVSGKVQVLQKVHEDENAVRMR